MKQAIFAILLMLKILLPLRAFADEHQGASPDDIFCISKSIFVGKITKIKSEDCRLRSPICEPVGSVKGEVLITQVIKSYGNFKPGNTEKIISTVRDDAPIRIGNTVLVMHDNDTGRVFINNSGAPINDKMLKDNMEGKLYVIGVSTYQPNTDSYYVFMWNISRLSWILASIKDPRECLKDKF